VIKVAIIVSRYCSLVERQPFTGCHLQAPDLKVCRTGKVGSKKYEKREAFCSRQTQQPLNIVEKKLRYGFRRSGVLGVVSGKNSIKVAC
jgi:hypothetical protein